MLSNDKNYLKELEKECELKNNPQILNNLAWYYFKVAIKGCSREQKKERIMQAVSLLESALQLDKNSFYVCENLGEANFELNKIDLAKAFFERASMMNVSEKYIAQNNLSAMLFELKQYGEAEHMLIQTCQSIISGSDRINDNIAIQLENIEGFKILYNYAVSLFFTKQYEKCKECTNYILNRYERDVISIDDVDLLDIVELYYLLCDYKKVIEIFPKNGYDISPKYFGIYMYSCFQQQRSLSAYYNEIISEIQEQCEDYQKNEYISEENKMCLIGNLQSRIQELDVIYEQIQQGKDYKIDSSLKLISTTLLYDN